MTEKNSNNSLHISPEPISVNSSSSTADKTHDKPVYESPKISVSLFGMLAGTEETAVALTVAAGG